MRRLWDVLGGCEPRLAVDSALVGCEDIEAAPIEVDRDHFEPPPQEESGLTDQERAELLHAEGLVATVEEGLPRIARTNAIIARNPHAWERF